MAGALTTAAYISEATTLDAILVLSLTVLGYALAAQIYGEAVLFDAAMLTTFGLILFEELHVAVLTGVAVAALALTLEIGRRSKLPGGSRTALAAIRRKLAKARSRKAR